MGTTGGSSKCRKAISAKHRIVLQATRRTVLAGERTARKGKTQQCRGPWHTNCSMLVSIPRCQGYGSPYLPTETENETFTTGFYPDRTDDRSCDRRYPGGHRAAGVSGLRDSFEDVRRRGCSGGVQDLGGRVCIDQGVVPGR